MFADDCLLYKTIKSPQDAINLQQDLLAMQIWKDVWLMQFNIVFCYEGHSIQEYQVLHD